MKSVSFKSLQKKYGGMYVLMDKPKGKVIAASKNLGEAFKKAENKGYKLPFVQFVEPFGMIAIYEVKVSLRK
ncbi:MAG: hypothetical protein G01um101493_9 [Microgenomates group bacterium Gr01-1014_93]|nr:MAG: hypothetical protein G01um101493_9 [Microgenomates group bacterium Gr01-1014_93]